MAGFLFFGIAFGSTLTVDAKLATEVLVDGRKIVEAWEPARIEVEVPAGPHVVRIYRAGQPTDLELVFEPNATIDLVVGRTGITADSSAAKAKAEEAQTVPIELRAIEATQIRIGKQRYVLGDGEDKTLSLKTGSYPISVRNPAGTVIWARGNLVVRPGARVVVQLASGRMPEVSGAGRFDPGSP
ncbi:MAG: hypothetical protein AAGA48_22475 [Myxococcota bacterium]